MRQIGISSVAVFSVVLIGLLFAAQIAEAKHFTVRVAEEEHLSNVASALTQKGFYVNRINKKFKFVSFSTSPPPSGDAGVSAASLDGAAHKVSETDCALIGESPDNTPLYTGTDASKCSVAGSSVQPTFVGPARPALVPSAAAISPVEAAIQSLESTIPGIIVEEDPQVYLTRNYRQHRTVAVAPSQTAAASCTPGPDGAIGKTTEEVPYGIKMVQAIDAGMIEVSKNFKQKTMFCVIDTGVDINNLEFSENTFGCVPKQTRPSGTNTSCKYPFSKDWSSHGTHTSGTIAAQRNGKGIVGVSAEGALLYHFNAFGPMGTFSMSEVIIAITDCVNELDNQRQVKNTPDMKLIVSMSFGAEGDTPLVREAVKTLARERHQDMLLVAAAGNGAQEGAVYSYPAAWPEVVSIAAVDWAGKKAAFSQVNEFNDWAAPGVLTLSTIPIADASTSGYNTMPQFTITPAARAEDEADFLTAPAPRLLGNSKNAKVTGQLINCGLAKLACAGAEGKICLIQRGENTFCQKVTNCAAGGGIGAVIFGRDDQPDCESFDGSLEGGCTAPAGGWPVALTITKAQGLKLKEEMAANAALEATIDARKSVHPLPYDFMSGTSMATPTAAGVAGLVWSAHTECSAPELRAAVSWTARDLGAAGFDNEYGHGLVQAAAAHKYLQDNLCTGTRTPAEPPRGTPSQQQPTDQSLPKLNLTSNFDSSRVRIHVGDTVKFTVKISATADGHQISKVPVRIRAVPAYSLACGTTSAVQTGADGTAEVSCTVVNPGQVSLEARIGNKDAGTLVVASNTIRVFRGRRSQSAAATSP